MCTTIYVGWLFFFHLLLTYSFCIGDATYALEIKLQFLCINSFYKFRNANECTNGNFVSAICILFSVLIRRSKWFTRRAHQCSIHTNYNLFISPLCRMLNVNNLLFRFRYFNFDVFACQTIYHSSCEWIAKIEFSAISERIYFVVYIYLHCTRQLSPENVD